MSLPTPVAPRWTFLCLLTLGLATTSNAQHTGMVEFFAGGKLQTGLTLVELAHEVVVLGRDGWMHSLDPAAPESQIRPVEEPFSPTSVTQLRNELRAEFGRGYEVVATQHFLVVQPVGRGDRWPRLFETSHRAFVDYMRKRGVQVRQGRFPMVAIVLPDETAMYAEFAKLGLDAKRVAGLYAGESNRVLTHDGGQLSSISATVRHEAAHQSAFNSGVHSRLNDTPRWISEGVGQMFEPAGMTDTRSGAALSDRVNRDSLALLRSKYPDRYDPQFAQTVMQLVSDDSMFGNDKQVDQGYAVAWAMMFYLAEREPEKFARLLNHTAGRPPFREYPRTERVREFEQIIGTDTHQFSKQVAHFLQSL